MAIKPEYWVGQSASETLTGDFWDSRSPFGWQPEAAEMMNISSKVNHEYLRIVFFSLNAQSPCKSKLCQGFHHFEPFSESRLFGDERILLCFHAECDIFSLLGSRQDNNGDMLKGAFGLDFQEGSLAMLGRHV
jgi:hypothetical protein